MELISIGSLVRFTSPEDGNEYVGTVESIGRTSIASVRYRHRYGNELIEQRECMKLMRLEIVK